jgi:hypothetical protein
MKTDKTLYLVYPLIVSTLNQTTINSAKPLFFSEKNKAESMIKNFKEHYGFLYEIENQEEKVYCIVMEEYALDLTYRYQLSTRVYNENGDLLNDCMVPDDGRFIGRINTTVYHRVGDFVEIPCGDNLKIGIVAEQPLFINESNSEYNLTASDDCYTIIEHPDHLINYAHTPFVFKPQNQINEDIQQELKEALSDYSETIRNSGNP